MLTARSKDLEKAARVFHALSDATRLRILHRLQAGEQCVCDLTDEFQTGQSRLSFHLKVLKEAGLVNDRPEGRWMYYSVNAEALEELEKFITEVKRVTRSSVASKCC
ncbi:ArsR/SmtB family transcription factor [Nitrospira sp. Nam80]